MRPATLDEVVGQDHLLGPGSPLRRLVEGGGTTSALLWGPPGSGKTTVARLIAAGRRFVELSAVTSGVKDVRAAIDEAKERLGLGGERGVLFVGGGDPVKKAPQGAPLPGGEGGPRPLGGGTP